MIVDLNATSMISFFLLFSSFRSRNEVRAVCCFASFEQVWNTMVVVVVVIDSLQEIWELSGGGGEGLLIRFV